MKRKALACCLLLFACAAIGQTPATVRRGTVNDSQDGPTLYAFAVPTGWADGRKLAIVYPEFSMATPDPNPIALPASDLLEPLLAANYAVIEFRALRHRTWKPRTFGSYAVGAEFFRQFGASSEIIYIGDGLAGLEVAKTNSGFSNGGAGVLATCAPLAGDRQWDRALDLRLAYDSICANVAGGTLSPGSPPWPWALDLDSIPSGLTDFGPYDHASYGVAGSALAACTGIDSVPADRTAAQQANLVRLKAVAGTQDEIQFRTAFGFAVFALSDLVRRDFQPDLPWFGNHRAVYSDALLQADITRISADPMSAYYFKESTILRREWRDGSVPVPPGPTARPLPLLALQTDADGNVPAVGLGNALVRIHPAAISGSLVRADGRCDLSVAERMAGVLELAEWARGGARPTPATLQQRCLGMIVNALHCRFDATPPPTSLDGTFLPRVPALAIDGRYSGQWFDPLRPGEGLIVQVLAGQQALIYWFTYPAVGEPGDQLWLFGVGSVEGDSIRVDDVYRTRRLTNSTAESQRWGGLRLRFTGCGAAQFNWQGPALYGSGERQLVQLFHLQQQNCSEATPWPMNDTLSGVWVPPVNLGPFGAGEGFAFESVLGHGLQVTRFYYDEQGLPRWSVGNLQGMPGCAASTGVFCDSWNATFIRPHGTRFGMAFAAGDIRTELAGRFFFDSNGMFTVNHLVTVGLSPNPNSLLYRLTVPIGAVDLNTLWRIVP